MLVRGGSSFNSMVRAMKQSIIDGNGQLPGASSRGGGSSGAATPTGRASSAGARGPRDGGRQIGGASRLLRGEAPRVRRVAGGSAANSVREGIP